MVFIPVAPAHTACAKPFARSGAIEARGTITEGGGSGTFVKVVALATGFNVLHEHMGADDEAYGYNGAAWTYGNGIVENVDLPMQLEYRRAHAFVDRFGWGASRGNRVYSAAGMDQVRVTFDGARFPTSVTVDADDGPEITRFRDWRCEAGMYYPFEQETVDASGERSVLRVAQLRRVPASPQTFDAPPAAEHGTIGGTQPAVVPFAFTGKHDPHLLVLATVAGHETHLIFDTGGALYFGPRSAAAWNLPVSGGVNVGGAGAGSVNGGFARVGTVALGNATLRDQVAVIAPLPWPDDPSLPSGFAGLEFFANFRTTIDYQNRVLRFESFDRPSPPGGTPMRFYNDDGHMYVAAEVNGVRGLFGVDTGAGNAVVLFNRFADSAHVSASGSAASTSGAVNGAIVEAPARIASFAFAGSELTNVRAWISEMHSGVFASRGLAGNLGGGLFRCYAMTIDYRASTLTFTPQPDTDSCLAALSAP